MRENERVLFCGVDDGGGGVHCPAAHPDTLRHTPRLDSSFSSYSNRKNPVFRLNKFASFWFVHLFCLLLMWFTLNLIHLSFLTFDHAFIHVLVHSFITHGMFFFSFFTGRVRLHKSLVLD